jgi:putative oxidoreductase
MEIDVALLILRVVVGAVFLAHGVKHLARREKTTAWFGSIGFRQPELQWLASSASEIGIGLFLILGLLTAPAAAGLIAVMTVAFFSVHRYAGFWVTARPDEGWEFVLVLAAVGLSLAVAGPGSVSLDAALGIDDALTGWVGAAIAGLGVGAALAQLAMFYRPGSAAEVPQEAFPEE